jgi:asparagine synthase (glutamine-hydrolysing)
MKPEAKGERDSVPFESAFDSALAPWRGEGPPICILYSGGVDSGLLAWELRHRPGTRLFTIGRSGSSDLVAGERSAASIGLPWSGYEVQREDLEVSGSRIASETEGLSGVLRSVFVSLALAIQHAPEGELLCGQGADELFLGYAHFADLDPDRARSRAGEDLDRLLSADWPRTVRIAAFFGRRIHAPWLSPEFVAAARAVPLAQRLPGSSPKRYWRDFARQRGLPETIADRPKRALQYGTGLDRWIRLDGGARY